MALDEQCRLARDMIVVALEAERRAYLEAHAHETDAAGKRLVVVLPILCLRGWSTGDFAPALEGFFGSDAGLSASRWRG